MYDIDTFYEKETEPVASARFTTKERFFLAELFNDVSPELFRKFKAAGVDEIEEFLKVISNEWWNDQHP